MLSYHDPRLSVDNILFLESPISRTLLCFPKLLFSSKWDSIDQMPPLSVRKLMLGIITKMASIDLSSRNSFIALSGRSEVAQLSTRQPEHSRGSAEECVVV
jgi:hypothetical protein